MKRSLSITQGAGSISHNQRKFHAANVDPERIRLNTCFVSEYVHHAYDHLFGEALKNYNAKQKRKDRHIPDYYEKIRTSKQEKIFYEIIAQVGNREDMSATGEHGKLAETILIQYMNDFQQRNPNLYVFSAHLHMDEATPHLHIDFIPFTNGNKRSLETKNSLKGALTSMGFPGGSKGSTELSQWQDAEREVLAKVMLEHGVKREKQDNHREHLSVLDFKKQERSREVAELTTLVEEQKEMLTDLSQSVCHHKTALENIDSIETKEPLLDKSKVTIAKTDYNDLKKLAKKQVAVERTTKNLKGEVKNLKEENQTLKKEVSTLRSVQGKLDFERLKLDYEKLKQKLEKVLSFIDKLGLREKLDAFLNPAKQKGKQHGKDYLR